MTIILVDTSFNAFDTNPKNGKLDKNEVEAAHAKGCVWAKEGQTAIEYQQAKVDYDTAKKEESWRKITEAGKQPLDSIFNNSNKQKEIKHHIL